MRRLPKAFTVERYGLYARLVEESDAEFIIKLRTDPKVSSFLHKTDPDVELQKQWIREYKIREEAGTDYYFIFYKDGKPIGLDRLYDITDIQFNSGSWVFSTEAPFGSAFLAQLIVREIAFIDWGFEKEGVGTGVHGKNVNVIKYDIMAGMKEEGRYVSEGDEYILMSITKEDFLKGRKKVLRMLGIKDAYNG